MGSARAKVWSASSRVQGRSTCRQGTLSRSTRICRDRRSLSSAVRLAIYSYWKVHQEDRELRRSNLEMARGHGLSRSKWMDSVDCQLLQISSRLDYLGIRQPPSSPLCDVLCALVRALRTLYFLHQHDYFYVQRTMRMLLVM